MSCERDCEMKKYTCLNDEEVKIEGAIEGTKQQVLDWMERTFPGIHEPDRNPNMVYAFEFFYGGDITLYKTTDGKNVFLAEVLEEG